MTIPYENKKNRTIKFIVDGQIIKLDPSCDISNLVPGTEQYLRAEFTFSPEWAGYVKVASFHSMMGREYSPQVLTDGRTCLIPATALSKRIFKVSIVGKKDNQKLITNRVAISQNGGKT